MTLRHKTKHGKLWHGDCLKLMRKIPDGEIDMVLVDLPYGITACNWDSIIPLEPLWKAYKRICKPNAAMVFTSAQPFTTTLIASNRKMFRYCWYWIKNKKVGYSSAKDQPMRNVEEVVVFYRKKPVYNPQGKTRIPKYKLSMRERRVNKGSVYQGENHAGGSLLGKYKPQFTNYHHQTLCFGSDGGKHPTQKPVALFEYLIRTYTNPGDMVLDNTCGSGTTGVAASRMERRFICIEKEKDIYETAKGRIDKNERSGSFRIV